MKHLGDITKLNGAEIPVVDCITGGSPCQDLSVAGKRAGLDGERSGLFMEQIRIVKEMRKKEMENGRTAQLVRPRWMVWENVPGAFSSNGGKDFQAVLTEIVRIVNPECPDVPMPKDGRWSKAGCLYDELGRWSIAWRVHDAQFWGVPQRRKRIALVADFAGTCAPEVLFERKSLSGDSEPCGEAGQETAGAAGEGVTGAEPMVTAYGIDQQGGKGGANYTEDVCPPILSDSHGTPHAVSYFVDVYNQEVTGEVAASLTASSGGTNTSGPKVLCLNDQGGSVMGVSEDVTGALRAQEECSPTLSAVASGTNQVPVVYDARGNGDGKTVPTMTGDHQNRVTDYTALCVGNGQLNQMSMAEQANTLDTMHDQQAVLTTVGALCARDYKGVGNQYVEEGKVIPQNAIVRRLTPLECERLQGYPDGWTDIGDWVDTNGKKRKEADSPRYKALGNSIALPFWFYLLRRISATYERPATLGSLFDGIGGFPLCWERCNGKGTAVWASEIEEFPIAVTKKRFPDLEVHE